MNSSVSEFIRREVPDWDDEVVATARFKALSGQRSDWEPKFLFWRDLILKVARHLGVFIVRSSEVKDNWFDRGGLTPLCIDRVLLEMYNTGDILRHKDLVDPTTGRLSQLFKRVVNLIGVSRPSFPEEIIEEYLILSIPLQEKAAEVVKLLSESHWTSFCIITMGEFQKICNGSTEASAVLSYLSGRGKARYLSMSKTDFIEGVKVSLAKEDVPTISSLDYDVLRLIWTKEKLQRQLDVIDRRYEMSRKSALNCMKSGNKQVALRHAKQLKLTSEGREKCTSLLNRVEEVLTVIANAESTKKVVEAIEIGARAIKGSRISAEEVQVCLEELDESVASQKQVEDVLVSAPIHCTDIEDEDLEEEFKKLEMELGDETPRTQISRPAANISSRVEEIQKLDVSVCDTSSELKIADGATREAVPRESAESLSNKLSNLKLEAA
ncbi:Snf7 [Macleaya cordata]|uniref:Snf7 n=1 Tax=Macleaya cordata TaxID=56857 RepID=A0A200R1Q7_MACCD|nr:Snf7 [Macleaya cordata]